MIHRMAIYWFIQETSFIGYIAEKRIKVLFYMRFETDRMIDE